MGKKRIAKFLLVIAIVLFIKVAIFGWWHFGGIRQLTAEVFLPIIVHILGGLGTIVLAWWLIDADVRSQAKREAWDQVLAKAFSDLRRNMWLAKELQEQSSSKVYGRYWINGLDELRLKLSKQHTQLEYALWSMKHHLDLCNCMLDEDELGQASQQASFLIQQIQSLRDPIEELHRSLEGLEVEKINFEELLSMEADEKKFLTFACPQEQGDGKPLTMAIAYGARSGH